MRFFENPGRSAGLWYLLLAIVGPVRLIYIPSKLIVSGDAAETARRILAHEMLFRVGMAADVLGAVVLIFVALALYHLFEEVNRRWAVLVVILGGVVPATIYFVNVAKDAATLLLVKGAPFLAVFTQAQREALAYLFLRLHTLEIIADETIWGLWLLPLGALVYRSGMMPRWIGVLLWLHGFAYIALSFTGILGPQYVDAVSRYTTPIQFGEPVFMLWLVVVGTRERATTTANADSLPE
jgi:hypothetical protein